MIQSRVSCDKPEDDINPTRVASRATEDPRLHQHVDQLHLEASRIWHQNDASPMAITPAASILVKDAFESGNWEKPPDSVSSYCRAEAILGNTGRNQPSDFCFRHTPVVL